MPPKTKSRPAAKKAPPVRARLIYYIHPPDPRYRLRRVALNDQSYDKRRLAGLEFALPAVGRALRLYGDVLECDHVFKISSAKASRPTAMVVDLSFAEAVVTDMVGQARALQIPILFLHCRGYFPKHLAHYGRQSKYQTYGNGAELLTIINGFLTPLPAR